MVRVKKGKTRHKKRERLLKKVKGFKWKRKSKYRYEG
jgi:ribosomal protein L20